jgi:hypothetical protein
MDGESISVFKGIFPIFGLPSPISGCCKPRFLDFQSRFLVNLPKIFFRYEIHLIFRMSCKFPFFGVISDFRRAKNPKNLNISNSALQFFSPLARSSLRPSTRLPYIPMPRQCPVHRWRIQSNNFDEIICTLLLKTFLLTIKYILKHETNIFLTFLKYQSLV